MVFLAPMSNYHFHTPIDEALFESRIVQVSGGVDSNLAYDVNRKLLALEKSDAKAPIYLFIDSPGGEVNSGFSIFDTAKFIEPEVYTVVVGLAASMGSLIALCAKPENRFAFPNGKFLIHQPLIMGTIYGSASDVDIRAKDIIRTREKINRLYAQETKRSYEEIVKATDRDYWMSAEEAKSFGLISKIVSRRSELK